MVNCTECHLDIDHLNFDVNAGCMAQLYKGETSGDYDIDCLTEDVEFNNWSCPECEEVLFLDESKAIKFLNGEDKICSLSFCKNKIEKEFPYHLCLKHEKEELESGEE